MNYICFILKSNEVFLLNNKLIKGYHFVIIAVFTILLGLSITGKVYAGDTANFKKVLIINSYHEGLAWTRDETAGIIKTLNDSGEDVSISVEYMDWKNHPDNQNLQYLADYLNYKYQSQHIDIIIATDDAALHFALSNRQSLFSNAPVVFCGVDQSSIAQIINKYKNVTGVIEQIDPTETINMALKINPSIKNIYVLYDNSESGKSSGKLVIDKINSMNKGLKAIPLNDKSYEELIQGVRNYGKDSIILVTTYYSDVYGKVIDFENVSREVSKNSNVPVYHLYDLGLNNGAIGGNMISGKLQGESAAKMAVSVLKGENPDNIPIVAPRTTRNVFDFKQMERFGIPLSKIPENYEVINKPFSFFQTYRSLVFCVLGLFFLMAVFIVILLFNISKINRMKKELAERNHELSQIYEELSASDEELKQQYDEMLINHEKIMAAEEKLTCLAYHDVLTGLPNKLSLYEKSDNNTLLLTNSTVALLFIDMDDFKYINDTMGHASGDQLIIKVSERLNSLLKEDCYLYRLSGDEFTIIIQNISGKADAEIFASHILAGFKEEFEVLKSELHISLSIGIAMYPEHGLKIEELLKNADIAMYKSKAAGKNKYTVYDESMNEAFMERANIEKFLYTALGKNEFEIYYQPQLDINQNKITGFEALLRWNSSDLGFVSPTKFIKVAEDTHIIIQLGGWVLRNACAFIKKLHKKGYTDLYISVNISILQLLQTEFTDMVTDILDYYELEPDSLELEITESILMESFDAICRKLESLREIGIRIALDDFGTGYSSLNYLKQLPITTLKIDKSFVDNISLNNESETLTGHIIAIGKSMGMSVVAEGVEKQEQLDYLIQHGCHKIQGYLFSKPVTEAEIEHLLEE